MTSWICTFILKEKWGRMIVEFLTRYPVNADSYVICLNTVFHCWDLCKLPDNVIVHRISFWSLRTIKRNLWWSFDWWTSQKVILIYKLVNMYVQSSPRTILMTIIQMQTIVLSLYTKRRSSFRSCYAKNFKLLFLAVNGFTWLI